MGKARGKARGNARGSERRHWDASGATGSQGKQGKANGHPTFLQCIPLLPLASPSCLCRSVAFPGSFAPRGPHWRPVETKGSHGRQRDASGAPRDSQRKPAEAMGSKEGQRAARASQGDQGRAMQRGLVWQREAGESKEKQRGGQRVPAGVKWSNTRKEEIC